MNHRRIIIITIAILVASSGDNSAFAFQIPPSSSTTTFRFPTHSTITSTFPTKAQYATSTYLRSLVEVGNEPITIQSIPSSNPQQEQQQVPTQMPDALRIFFLSGDYGPSLVVLSILYFGGWRMQLVSPTTPIGFVDVGIFLATILFWSLQEHVLHQHVLHSTTDWFGKDIHQGHHEKPYYHISIDPAGLLLGWMMVAHGLFRVLLPLNLALSATCAYSLAGLFYEWAHYIVHTKVPVKKVGFWKRVKENHIKHHMVDQDYWFAFSLGPWVDDWFGTNPPVQQVKRLQKQQQQQQN